MVIRPYLLSESGGFKYYVGDNVSFNVYHFVELLTYDYGILPTSYHSRLTLYIYNVFEHLLPSTRASDH